MRKEIKTAFLAIGIILLLIAAACLALYFAWQGQIAVKERSMLLYVGIGCAVAAVVCVVISLCIKSQPQNKPPKSKGQPSLPSATSSQQSAQQPEGQQAQPSEQQYAQQTAQQSRQPEDLPQGAQPVPRQSPMLIHMGERQSTEEKFAEIAKMDKTQFVVYAARLFGYRGYRVKFTPVIDNYDVDLLVEKMGVTIAVGCVLSDKVLSAQDVAPVAEGRRYYHASAVMVVTNSYFDRSALDYAKQNNLSLVDRNVLSQDFM